MAASMQELLLQYKAQQAEAEARAKKLQEANTIGNMVGSQTLGAVGAIAAPIAANFLTEVFGLNKRSAGEEAAMAGLRNVAQGGTTQAQAGINYARSQAQSRLAGEAARGTAQQQASAQRQAMRIGQEGQAQFAAQLADKRAQEQEQAMRAVASMEKQYADEQRRRMGMMAAGSIEGGLGALSKAYGGYLANKQRVDDLSSQAEGAASALKMLNPQSDTQAESGQLLQPIGSAPVPMIAQQAKQSAPANVIDVNPAQAPSTVIPTGEANAGAEIDAINRGLLQRALKSREGVR
jgi:hypothetical protein